MLKVTYFFSVFGKPNDLCYASLNTITSWSPSVIIYVHPSCINFVNCSLNRRITFSYFLPSVLAVDSCHILLASKTQPSMDSAEACSQYSSSYSTAYRQDTMKQELELQEVYVERKSTFSTEQVQNYCYEILFMIILQ